MMNKKLIATCLLTVLLSGCGGNNGTNSTSVNTSSTSLTSSQIISTSVDELTLAKQNALAELGQVYDSYIPINYEVNAWIRLTDYYNAAKSAIEVAIDIESISTIVDEAIENMSQVEALKLGEVKENQCQALLVYLESLDHNDYLPANWSKIQEHYENGITNINNADTISKAVAAFNTAQNAIAAVVKIEKIFTVSGVQVHGMHYTKIFINIEVDKLKASTAAITINSCTAGATVYHEGPFAHEGTKSWIQVVTAGIDLTNLSYTLNLTIHLLDGRNQDLTLEILNGNLMTIEYARLLAIAELEEYIITMDYLEYKYESNNWDSFVSILSSFRIDIENANSYTDIDDLVTNTKQRLDNVERKVLNLSEVITHTLSLFDQFILAKIETQYSAEKWNELNNLAQIARSTIESATTIEEVNNLFEQAKIDINGVERLNLSIAPTRIEIYGDNLHIGIYWETQFLYKSDMLITISINEGEAISPVSGGVFDPSGAFWNFFGNVDFSTGAYSILININSIDGLIMIYELNIIDGSIE